jgi:hypothetical protein
MMSIPLIDFPSSLWCGAARLDLFQGQTVARQLGPNAFDHGASGEGFGLFIPGANELGDGRLRIGNAGEGAASLGIDREQFGTTVRPAATRYLPSPGALVAPGQPPQDLLPRYP